MSARPQPVERRRAIAVAQSCPVAGDVEANVRQHIELARLATGVGAELVLFPELSLTGYEISLGERLALSPADPPLAPLLQFAAAAGATLVVGAPVRGQAGLHIASIVVGPEGIAATYTKRRLGAFPGEARRHGTLPPPEHSMFRPGDSDPLIPCGGGLAAMAICADIGDPEHPRLAAARGARSYLASVFLTPSDMAGECARLRDYAIGFGMVVAMANFACASGGLEAGGRSTIWSASGEQLVTLREGAGVAVAIEGRSGWTCLSLPLRGGAEHPPAIQAPTG
jgi:predicted amidohydrolase